jgi:hypothetical protein
MREIIATGDTLLHTAGKYCTEDILVKVPMVEGNPEVENPPLQEKTVYDNGEVTPDAGYYGLSKVNVNVPTKEPVLQDRTFTENGTYNAGQGYDGFGEIKVDVPEKEPVLQEKNVTANGEVIPDNGYDGLSKVTVNVPTSGGGIDTSDANATEDDITLNATAYVKGVKLTGKNPYKKAETDNEVQTQEALIYQILQELEGKASGESDVPSIITAGDAPVLMSDTMAYTTTSTSMTASGIFITVPKDGTYRFKFSCARTNTSGTWTAQLYKNDSAISGATATWNQYQGTYSGDISCNAGDKIELYVRSRGTQYRLMASQLVACIDWATGF